MLKTSNPSSGEFQDQMIDGRPLYELVGEKVAQWGEDCMGDEYSYIGAVVGATYPEMGKVLRKVMPKSYILVPGYGAQGGKGKDLVHFFNEDGLGAIVNSSRGIIAAYKQEKYANYRCRSICRCIQSSSRGTWLLILEAHWRQDKMADKKKEQAMVVSQEQIADGIFSMWIHTAGSAERQTWTVYFYVYKGCDKVIASSDQYL